MYKWDIGTDSKSREFVREYLHSLTEHNVRQKYTIKSFEDHWDMLGQGPPPRSDSTPGKPTPTNVVNDPTTVTTPKCKQCNREKVRNVGDLCPTCKPRRNTKCSKCRKSLGKDDGTYFCVDCKCQTPPCESQRYTCKSMKCKRRWGSIPPRRTPVKPTRSNSSTRKPCPFRCNSVPCKHVVNKPKCSNCRRGDAIHKSSFCGNCKCTDPYCPNRKQVPHKKWSYCTKHEQVYQRNCHNRRRLNGSSRDSLILLELTEEIKQSRESQQN